MSQDVHSPNKNDTLDQLYLAFGFEDIDATELRNAYYAGSSSESGGNAVPQ